MNEKLSHKDTVVELAAGIGRNKETIQEILKPKNIEIVELLQENIDKGKDNF